MCARDVFEDQQSDDCNDNEPGMDSLEEEEDDLGIDELKLFNAQVKMGTYPALEWNAAARKDVM